MENADLEKYSFSGFGISFDVRGTVSLRNGDFGKNLMIFCDDMILSVNVDNKTNIS